MQMLVCCGKYFQCQITSQGARECELPLARTQSYCPTVLCTLTEVDDMIAFCFGIVSYYTIAGPAPTLWKGWKQDGNQVISLVFVVGDGGFSLLMRMHLSPSISG